MRRNIVLVLSFLAMLAVNPGLWAREPPWEEAPRPLAINFGFNALTGKLNAIGEPLPLEECSMIVNPLELLDEDWGTSMLWVNFNSIMFNRRFLPGKDELAFMDRKAKRTGFDDFRDPWYLSPAQRNDNGAWAQPFGDGGQVVIKVYPNTVRAVKTF